MTNAILSSLDFAQRPSEAKLAANNGPVFITDGEQPTHVLMAFEAYQRLTKQRRNIADVLAMPSIDEMDLEVPRVIIEIREADFS